MMCSLYILQSETTGRYYIGSSKDPESRKVEHNSGRTIATRNKGPWKLVFVQEYPDTRTARQIEYKLKKMKSRKITDKIIQEGIVKMSV